MDLHRVVTASGDITKELPKELIITFLEHADNDFDKTSINEREKVIREDLRRLASKLGTLSDPHERLKWTEDVMTARCRL